MSIPKGLILYKAPKCQENHPVNIKQGYYSDKILTSKLDLNRKSHLNFHCRYQKKFIQEISLKIYCEDEVLETLPKFSHIKRCKFEPAVSYERSIKPAIEVFQKVSKILKRIKRLELPLSGHPNDIAQGFETLLMLSNLEFLTLPSFSYSESDTNMKLFMETVGLASKRRSWPHLKSLNIQFQPPSTWRSSPEFDGLLTRSLGKLLEFMNDLRTCQKIYECSSFELRLARFSKMNPEQVNLLCEIAKAAPLINSIREFEMQNPQSLYEMIPHSKGLKAVGLILSGAFQPYIDFSVLKKLPDLQELTLSDIYLEKKLLTQIQSLENLTVLSLGIWEIPENDQTIDLAKVILDLENLKTLELKFEKGRIYPNKACLENCPWLVEAFQAIGKKSKLEKLSLYFGHLDYENVGSLFKELCQSLEKLTQLSDFQFTIYNADYVQDEELLFLCESLCKLTKIQNLNLQFCKVSNFDIKTYAAVVDRVVKSFPILSRLYLGISRTKRTLKDLEFLKERFNKMRCKVALSF